LASKIKIKLDIKTDLEKARNGFFNDILKTITDSIKSFISKGISPVSGQLRYDRYSESYRESIKRDYVKNKTKVSPVNLEQSGKMKRSLKAEKVSRGVKIEFTDEKAKYHDIEGAGKSKTIRRLLPNTGTRSGESFNKRLMDNIIKLYKDNIKKFVNRRG
jgi:hypothetical protein